MSGCLQEGPARQAAADNRQSRWRHSCFAWSSVLLSRVIVQKFWSGEYRRPFNDPVVLAIDKGIENRLMVCGDRLMERLLLAGHQIDTKLLGKPDEIAP